VLTRSAYVFGATDDPDFIEHLQRQMVRDGTRRYLRFIALADSGDPDDGYNLFAALSVNSDAQARLLARRYFHSTLAFGRVRGTYGLKHQ
jgi:hypothetical protein